MSQTVSQTIRKTDILITNKTNAGMRRQFSLFLMRWVCLLLFFSCTATISNDARELYNQGIAAKLQKDWEKAASLLLEARDKAGPDETLRFQSALQLAETYSFASDAKEDPQEKLETVSKAIAWLRDAAVSESTDKTPKYNLEILLLRAQRLADSINKGKNGLLQRIEKSIETQRQLRDALRGVFVMQQNDKPLALAPVKDIAENQRVQMADVSTVFDLIQLELDKLATTADTEKSPQDLARANQLSIARTYIVSARDQMNESRRQLRENHLSNQPLHNWPITGAHKNSIDALESLKSAKSQFLDPQQILSQLASEQAKLIASTKDWTDTRTQARPWYTADFFTEIQTRIQSQTQELLSRLPDSSSKTADNAVQSDPQKALAALASKDLQKAVSSMQSVVPLLSSGDTSLRISAIGKETKALQYLVSALEAFANAKQMIEIIYQSHSKLQQRLVAEQFSDTKRQDGFLRNDSRIRKLEAILQTEKQAPAQGATNPGQEEQQPDPKKEELYNRALELRESIEKQLANTHQAIQQNRHDHASQYAVAADTELSELRRLFFSLVEHLKQLYRDQAQTQDKVAATADTDDPQQQVSKLEPLHAEQTQHTALASALTEEMQKMVNAASAEQSNPSADPSADPEQAEKLQEAIAEMQEAITNSQTASDFLSEAIASLSHASYDMEPLLAEQISALEHIAMAIRILEPPQESPDKQNDDKKEQSDSTDADDSDQNQQKDQGSKQQQQMREQRIRDQQNQRYQQKKNRQNRSIQKPQKDW